MVQTKKLELNHIEAPFMIIIKTLCPLHVYAYRFGSKVKASQAAATLSLRSTPRLPFQADNHMEAAQYLRTLFSEAGDTVVLPRHQRRQWPPMGFDGPLLVPGADGAASRHPLLPVPRAARGQAWAL